MDDLERVIIEHKLQGEELICPKCGSELVEIGVKSKKEILKYVPAKLIVEDHIIYSYACKSCEKQAEDSGIVSAQMSKTIFYNSMASNELVAHAVSLKYQHRVHFNRSTTK